MIQSLSNKYPSVYCCSKSLILTLFRLTEILCWLQITNGLFGVGNLVNLNFYLFQKWHWRYDNGIGLYVKIIKCTHGIGEG